MRQVNHRMLMLAREARGYTQSDLVSNIDKLSQGNYSRMEKGILPITDDILKKISSFLNFPESFFYRSEPLVTQAEYFYRKKASLGKKDLYQLEAKFDLIRFWFNDLLNEIEINEFNIPELTSGFHNTPEVIAQKTRAYLQAPKGPLDNLIHILEKNGVIIYFLNEAPRQFDGTTIITKSNHKIIVVNSSMPNYRKRFTIAHELGHIVMHIPSSAYLEEYIDVENEANRFASEFLMPENEIRRDLLSVTYSKLSDLKQYWKASKSSLIRRASDLRCITKPKYTSMMIELSRYDERRIEKVDVHLDEPKLLDKIINAFLKDMSYSQEELQDTLSLSAEDFSRYLLKNEKAVHRMHISV